ncbi:MAG: UbiA-like polyprenyltransferase [Sphingobacteriaceae bacterium]
MRKYVSLVLFAHTIFALPFACIGFFLALNTTAYNFSWVSFALMLACMVFARNSAMAFNRYLDRSIDAKNPRTATRDIPVGKVKPQEALVFTVLNSGLFITSTYFINPLCLALSPIALLVVLGYSYTKRFTPLCHLVLGLGLALAPIGAYLVVTGAFAWTPVFFSLAVLCWVSGFDIIYALQDEAFDKQEKLFSIPAWLGAKKALRVSEILHVLALFCLIMPLFYTTLSWFYLAGLAFFATMLVYQHRLVKPNDLSKVDRAFQTTNGLASVIFAGCYFLDVWFRSPL